MKRFALILALCGLLLSILGCKQAKEGPFTFTNKTPEKVYAIISQDRTIEKEFDAGESYTGEDYFVPKISFVKDFASEENKKITDNRFAASTTKGFDYDFEKAEGTKILITVILPTDFETTVASLKDCYLGEAEGKLSDYSDTSTDFKLTTIASGTEKTKETLLYTEEPDFRIYQNKTVDGKTEREDLTNLFSLSLGKSEIPPAADTTDAKPTIQWSLEITYPKMEPVD